MEQSINEGHLAFQKLVEVSGWGVTLLNAQFKVMYRSAAAERINGWDQNKRGKDNQEINIYPDDRLQVDALMQRVAHQSGATETCTFRSKHFSGNYIWLQCSFTNMLEVSNVQAIVCNFVDVSEQKLGEAELIKKSEQITELLETMTDGFSSLDENLCYTYANGQALKIFRKRLNEVIGEHIWDIFPEAIGSATYEAIQTAFLDKKYVCNEDFFAPHQLWVENRVYPSGTGISMFFRNITKQKTEEHRLKLLESVITNTTDSVIITEAEPFDLPGPRILYVNEAFTKMTGYTAEEVIGKTPRILQGPKTDKTELKRLGACLRRWELCEATLINYKKNGEEFWINFVLNPVADQNGWFTHWVSIERDVTERKNKELQDALFAEVGQLFNEPMELNLLLEKLLKKVVDYDHFVMGEIWLTGADINKLSMVAKTSSSSAGEEFYKQTVDFTTFEKGQSLPGAVWESGKLLVWDYLEKQPNFHRSEAARNAGVKTAYGIPIISEKVTIGVLVLGATEKRSEQSIPLTPLFEKLSTQFGVEIRRKQLEGELNQIFRLAPDIICALGTDGYLKKLNPAMSNLLGFTEAELLAQPLEMFLHPNDLAASNLLLKSFIDGEEAKLFENRIITKTGKVLWLSWKANLNVREQLFFCVAKDITDKKQVEDSLQASEANLTAVIESTDALIYSLDRNLNYVAYNNKLKKILWEHYQVKIYPGYNTFEFIDSHFPELHAEWQEVYSKALAGEIVQFEKEFIVGKSNVVHSFAVHPMWQKGKVTGLSCFVTDITARKLADSLLIESEGRYSDLFQLSPLSKFVFDVEDLQILDVNEAASKQYGYTKEEFLQMSIKQLRPAEEIPLALEVLGQLKQTKGTTKQHAIVHQKKNCKKIIVDIQSNPILYKGKSSRIAVATDITETLTHIQAIEAQNKKLKEISWLQSHVVRAPLARIMGLIALVDISEDLPEETKKIMGYILQSAHELDEVIHDIVLKSEVIDPQEK